MRAGGEFALFDDDGGKVLLLSDWRRSLELAASLDPAPVFAAIEAAAAGGDWIALAADYALGASFEQAVASASRDRPVLRASVFGHGQWLDTQQIRDFLGEELAALPDDRRIAGIADLVPTLEEAKYTSQVRRIQRWIADGDCYQINLTFPLRFQLYGDPLALYAALRERQPVRYGGYLRTRDTAILSFSPELFFARTGRRILTRPMKGTAARGATPQEDAERRAALLASAKERAENIMIVDLLRNDLGRLARPGKVRVEELCQTEAYPTLWQMVSSVSAEVHDASLVEVFGALFPCGSVTGAPKIHAMRRIAEIEESPRGLYTGALGWLAPNGDCRFNVAIRTIEAWPDGRGVMGVGSGIVADAEPSQEYAECLLKGSFLTAFDPAFELLETLRLEAGIYPLLSLHLDRLQSSARALGFTCVRATVTSALAREAACRPSGVFRVRLTLAHAGSCHVHATPLTDDPGKSWKVVLATETLAAGDYLLRHKTTARGRYDRALATLANRPEVFDAIFLNDRGEVCEGARSNVFVERGGVLLTPPLACGLLPGVMRRSLLESGRAVEQVLRIEDLLQASSLYVANAVRGLMPASLQD
ncbi:MAG: aminodeoxychorismate synthase component I [Candidatus Accumulibacter sp.]|uniref:aminodeoxychorismate synthase component I n=1 Tax=Accumulibacter sp. TaxID=2053492 RepID=UPI0025E62108|nr:aminodeoxychorismate synthase component I [Accumulibacter sp.]MCM8599101.1 aminodeoxychorismate synthase component I [Accumulibacter sp.]MCM8662403.1 aminodeoxychorismate synthase component I [Accumulibacter sp.]